ncbi:reticulon-like protein B9 isoform X1 [Zingiber officinale]|uniref:reticulon-like protein B9 isoform X1 n=1 Tax=Zingiber officinale TaxID=94328 RepID=UPI001C4C1C38|nr:reticulon-like protein B9 isoform X1 [Zingiber officinale]
MSPHIIYDSESDELPKAAAATATATSVAASPITNTVIAAAKRRANRPKRSLHDHLGGGKIADVLLWRNNYLSAGILTGATIVWFMFEVAEYHFLTLMCYTTISAMFVIFIWSNFAVLTDRSPPKIPEIILSEHAFKELTLSLHSKISGFASTLQDIARGKDLKMFLLAIALLWLVSEIGSFCSSLNLLYLSLLCAHTLPALYDRYEDEVKSLAMKGSRDLRVFYETIDSKFLNKIPRGPVKEKFK